MRRSWRLYTDAFFTRKQGRYPDRVGDAYVAGVTGEHVCEENMVAGGDWNVTIVQVNFAVAHGRRDTFSSEFSQRARTISMQTVSVVSAFSRSLSFFVSLTSLSLSFSPSPREIRVAG